MPEKKPPLIILTGPTACGKSETGVCLAEKLNTEIISADSVQVYKYFNIGSAKPPASLLRRIKHHLINVAEPSESFNVSRFKEEATKIAEDLWSRGMAPLVVGGTGLYLKGLIEGLHCGYPINDDVERKMDTIVEKEGASGLYNLASEIDPKWMAKVHPNDTFRTRRAVGVFMSGGKTLSELFAKAKPMPLWDTLFFVMDFPRKELYHRIESRVDKMMADGFREEVKALRKMGYNGQVKPMHSLGYSSLYEESEKNIDPAETLRLIKKATKAFARRQLTWFRKAPGAIFLPVSSDDTPDMVTRSIMERDETRKFFRRHNISVF